MRHSLGDAGPAFVVRPFVGWRAVVAGGGNLAEEAGDAELEARVVDVLLRGIPRAEGAAVVRFNEDGSVKLRATANSRMIRAAKFSIAA